MQNNNDNDNDNNDSQLYTIALAGELKHNDYLIFQKSEPCQIVDVVWSKTGKHGHRKGHFIGINIFTDKKRETILNSDERIKIPIVKKTCNHTFVDFFDDYVTFYDSESKTTKSLPVSNVISNQIEQLMKKQKQQSNRNLLVHTIIAMNEEKITSVVLSNK